MFYLYGSVFMETWKCLYGTSLSILIEHWWCESPLGDAGHWIRFLHVQSPSVHSKAHKRQWKLWCHYADITIYPSCQSCMHILLWWTSARQDKSQISWDPFRIWDDVVISMHQIDLFAVFDVVSGHDRNAKFCRLGLVMNTQGLSPITYPKGYTMLKCKVW